MIEFIRATSENVSK